MTIIYAIPGLGTTKELFQYTTIGGHELKVLEWPSPTSRVSMKEYAALFLSQIDLTRPVNLLGVSFGGMICMEIAGLIKVEKITLISSAKCRTELPYTIRLLKYFPVYRLLSENANRRLACRSRRVVGFDKSFLPVFVKMIYSMPEGYFINCIRMIANWNKSEPSQPVFHLHGNADRLLMCRYIKNHITVNKGTHAMIVNQAKEINDLLNQKYNGL